jgi:hypothetical protein
MTSEVILMSAEVNDEGGVTAGASILLVPMVHRASRSGFEREKKGLV